MKTLFNHVIKFPSYSTNNIMHHYYKFTPSSNVYLWSLKLVRRVSSESSDTIAALSVSSGRPVCAREILQKRLGPTGKSVMGTRSRICAGNTWHSRNVSSNRIIYNTRLYTIYIFIHISLALAFYSRFVIITNCRDANRGKGGGY